MLRQLRESSSADQSFLDVMFVLVAASYTVSVDLLMMSVECFWLMKVKCQLSINGSKQRNGDATVAICTASKWAISGESPN